MDWLSTRGKLTKEGKIRNWYLLSAGMIRLCKESVENRTGRKQVGKGKEYCRGKGAYQVEGQTKRESETGRADIIATLR